MSDDPYRRLFGQDTDPYDSLFGPSAAKDEWVRKGIVEINTRTGEKRPARKHPKAQEAVGKVETPESGVMAALKETPRMVAASTAENLASLSDIPGAVVAPFVEAAAQAPRSPMEAIGPRRPGIQVAPEDVALPNPLRRGRKKIREFYDESVKRYADATSSLPTPLAAGAYLATETAGNLLDPMNLLGAGVAVDATRPALRDMAAEAAQRLPEPRSLPTPTRTITPGIEELQRASLAIGEDSPVAAVADAMAHAGSDVSPEAINRVARGERYYRLRPDGTPVPILNDVSAVDVKPNPGEAKVRVDASGRVDIEAGRLNAAQQRALADLTAEKPAAPARQAPVSDEPLALEEVADEDALLASLGVRRSGSSVTTKAEMPEATPARTIDPEEIPAVPPEQSLARYSPVMFHETDTQRLHELLGLNYLSPRKQIFVASDRGLAIGQGMNRGVMVEFDSAALPGRPHTGKPGLAFTGGEFIAYGLDEPAKTYSRAIRAVEFLARQADPFERNFGRAIRRQLEEQGWTSRDLGDRIRLEPPRINSEAGFVKAEMLSSLDRWITENLNSGGMFKAAAKDFAEPAQKEFVAGLPKKLEGMQGSYQVQMDDMRRRQSDLLSAAKAAGLRGDRLRQAMEDVTAVRLGEKTLDSLPETMREPALAMFDQFDMLTNEMVDSGMLTEAQKEVVTGNFGNYVHRAYEMHDNPKWLAKHAPPGGAPTGGSPQWENAFSYLRGELGTADKVGSRVHLQDGRSGRITSLTEDGRAFVRFDDGQLQMVPRASLSGATDDQIAGILRGLIDREGGAMRVLTVPGGPRQLNAILQQRQAIPAPLRELMGEYKDFRVVAEKTVHNMAWDLAAYRFFKETADEGAALGVFRPKGDSSGLVYAKIVGEGQDTLGSRGALAELLTTPGLKKALEGTFEEVRSTWWSRTAGRIKAMKTVGSIQTQARNFISHGITTLANGHNPGNVVRYRQVGQILSGRQLATRRRAIQLGIINEGATSREIESYIKDLEQGGPVSKAGALVSKPFARMYKVSDDFWRTYNWIAETKDLRNALGLSLPEAEALAADRIRDTFQTYGRAPLLAEKLRRNPLVGAFPTFYIESVRNIGNIMRIGARDIKEGLRTGNQALVGLGMKKYVGLSAAIGSAYAVAQATRDEVGVSKQEEDAFRRLVAPAYMQNAELIFTAKEDGKSYTAFDWSFLNPYSALSKPVVAARRSMEQGKLPVQAVYELLESIAGGEILATVLAETVANQKIQDVYPFRLGGKISLPDQGAKQIAKDKGYHLYRAMAPGSITSGENILRGAGVLSQTTDTGKKYNLGTELLALAGPRVTTYEVAPSVKRQSVEAAVALRELTSDARRTVERVPDSLDEQAEVWVNAQERVYDRVRQMAQDGLTLKLERRDLFKTMRDGLLPPDWAARAMAGEEVPPPPNLEPRTDMERELLRKARELWKAKYGTGQGGFEAEEEDPYDSLF